MKRGKKAKIISVRASAHNDAQDADYLDKLNDQDMRWYEVFIETTSAGNRDAALALGLDPKAESKYASDRYQAHNRDITSKYRRYTYHDDTNEQQGITALQNAIPDETFRCARCLKQRACQCPAVQRHQPYGPKDWQQAASDPEKAYIESSKILREKAFDLLPYGDNPMGLQPGHLVKICLPQHYLRDRVGEVVDYREMDQAYLIRVARPALKDPENSGMITPPFTMCYVKGSGLTRFKPSSVGA